MRITIEVELGGSVWSYDDVVDALQVTAGTLKDSSEGLDVGEKGFVFNSDAEDVGQFIVREGSVADFHNLESA